MSNFSPLTTCMVCHTAGMATKIDLGNHALASRFPAPGEPEPPAGPLIVNQCTNCSHVQLGHQVAPSEIWRPGYGYRSSVNEAMRAHLQGIAHSFIGHITPGSVVIDIGSNDGELLRHFGGYFPGVHRIGIDPLGEPVLGAEIINEYFGTQDLPRAKVITSIAMFYDVPDPVGFANAVARTLTDDGIWCLEVGYLGAMWQGAWDSICHEHLGYYSLKALANVVAQAGLGVVHYEFNSANGGSVRCWLMKGAGQVRPTEPIWDLYELGREIGIAGKALRRFLVDNQGARIMALGASTKGNTLLQSCLSATMARSAIMAAVERFTEKVGRQLPGSRIPIISESDALSAPPDFFIVLPWHFRDSILARYRGPFPQTKFVFPLPKLEVV